ncbi:MAG: Ig-like domain-containing protein, partial [Pseudohongiella sp.]|nr:Ig-like domain-containing protein [Pseudohongiella sp.]
MARKTGKTPASRKASTAKTTSNRNNKPSVQVSEKALQALEPRMLLDAALAISVVDVADNGHESTVYVEDIEASAQYGLIDVLDDLNKPAAPVSGSTDGSGKTGLEQTIHELGGNNRREVVFIDGSLPDLQALLDAVQPGIDVVLIDSSSEGLQQIANWLDGKTNIDAIHIIGHGSEGEKQIGSTLLTSDNISAYAEVLSRIGKSLSDDGDILLYGCSVASDGEGAAFVDSISRLTGADVAASTDDTGNMANGGNWVLEYTTSSVETGSLFADHEPENFNTLLNNDVVDVNYQTLNFSSPVLKSGANAQTIGAIFLYSDVYAGVDAILTLVDIGAGISTSSAAFFTDNETTGATTGQLVGNQTKFLTPQMLLNTSAATAGAGVTYRIDLIAADSYNETTKTGTTVTLGNVRVNTYDIDIKQYQQFSTFTAASYNTGFDISVVYDSVTELVEFFSKSSTNETGDVTLNSNAAIKVDYDTLSSIQFKLGARQSGTAVFFIEFGTNEGIVHTTTVTPGDIAGAPPPTPFGSIASDTGSSSSDRITKNGQINVANLISGGTWEYSTNSGSSWTTGSGTTFTLSEGTYANDQVQIKQTGANAVTSAVTKLTGLTVDTTAPSAPTVVITEDANNDGFINTAELSGDVDVEVTLPSGLVAGDIINVSNGTTTNTVTLTGGQVTAGKITTSFTAPSSGTALTVTATATDIAGNVSSQGSDSATVDTTAPSAPSAPDLQAASDTGSSSTDNITSDNTPTFTGSGGTSGDTVTLFANGTQVGTAVVDGSGNWSITSSTLTDGSYSITAKYTDPAGNQSAASTALTPVVIDTTAPSAPSAPDLQAASDTGSSDTDNITSDNTPTFTGSGGTAGDTVTLFANGTEVGTATVDGSGNWSVTTSTLSDGSYSITAKYTDPAGNQSAASTALTPVVIDTTAPSAPSAPDLQASSDTGTSSTDNITSDDTPTFTGSGGTPGDTVTLYADGTEIGTAT